MPVHLKKPQQHINVRSNRGRHFDHAVAALAPAINELGSAGVCNMMKRMPSIMDPTSDNLIDRA